MSAQKIPVAAIVVVVLIALAFAGGCSAQGTVEIGAGLDTPVAKVDGGFITVRELLKHPGAITIVDELIYEKLINKKADAMGIAVTDDMAFEKIGEYSSGIGGRRAFMEEQWAMGLNYESVLRFSKLTLQQEMIIEGMVEEPSREIVLELLESQYGEKLFSLKAQELGKFTDEVTIEEVYDDGVALYKEIAKNKLFQEGKLEELLPQEYEVVNLLRITGRDDPDGEAWAAADPGTPAEDEPLGADTGTEADSEITDEEAEENSEDSETNSITPPNEGRNQGD